METEKALFDHCDPVDIELIKLAGLGEPIAEAIIMTNTLYKLAEARAIAISSTDKVLIYFIDMAIMHASEALRSNHSLERPPKTPNYAQQQSPPESKS